VYKKKINERGGKECFFASVSNDKDVRKGGGCLYCMYVLCDCGGDREGCMYACGQGEYKKERNEGVDKLECQ